MICPKCGKEVREGSAFCGSCGAPIQAPAQPGAVQQAPTPPSTMPMGQPAPDMPAPASPPAKPSKSKKPLLLGLVALAVIAAAVVIILGFVGPKWFVGGGGGQDTPEKAVDKFLKSLEDKDAKALLSLMDPDTKKLIEGIMKMMGAGSLEAVVNEEFFEYKSIKFSGVKYQTEIKDDRATVNIVAGTVTGMDADGKTFTEDISESEYKQIRLVKKDGNWYIKMEYM